MRQVALTCFAVLCLALAAVAQQEYVGKYDAYTGFTYAGSPGINLNQRGFHTQGGLNLNRWLSVGLDYSIFTGQSSLIATKLSSQVQGQLAALGASQGIPPAALASLSLPYHARTQTFAGGPQLTYRRFKRITFLVHPGLGIIHETVTAEPDGALQKGVVSFFQSTGQLTSAGTKSDTTYFIGVGGGVELLATPHVHLRLTTDYVHSPIFHGFLKNPQNVVRFSIGPTFNFGKNVVAH